MPSDAAGTGTDRPPVGAWIHFGLTEITAPGRLAQIGTTTVRQPEFDVQFDVLQRIRQAAPDAAVIDTVFSPVQTLVRSLGDSVMSCRRRGVSPGSSTPMATT